MHVVQFVKMEDFVEDVVAAGEVAGIYHNLHEQRISSRPQYGLSTWVLVTVVRAIVANGSVTHTAALTIPHGKAVERHYGKPFDPRDEARKPARWRAAREQHEVIVDELTQRLMPARLASFLRAGLVDVPADTDLVFAAHPLDELVDERAGGAAEEVITE